MSRELHACSVSRSFVSSSLLLVLAGVLVLAGCDIIGLDDESDEEEDPIEAIAIIPDSVSIEVGEQVDFSVVGLTASGDTARDASVSLRWWSTDTTVFTVEEDGLATSKGSGTAYCMVEVTNEAAGKKAGKADPHSRILSPLVPIGRDSAVVVVYLF